LTDIADPKVRERERREDKKKIILSELQSVGCPSIVLLILFIVSSLDFTATEAS
jgi:hypothetical protein